ncbi:MAG: VOC family protein [Bdellovibrionota bacterium]
MFLKNIHANYLFVSDVKKSSSWYSKVLDLPLAIEEDNFALIKISDNELCFHLADYKTPALSGGSVTYWRVEDLVNAMQHFTKFGAKIYRGPISIDDSNEGICQIKDPFGSIIGLQGIYKE